MINRLPSSGRKPMACRGGFTLIELLVVVAIISILASIAVPNFLDAQTRARVARTKADMRTLRVALEAYHVDNNKYPIRRHSQATATYKPHVPEAGNRLQQMAAITTPIAYLTILPSDVFEKQMTPPNNVIDYYDPTQSSWLINSRHVFRPARRVGPDQAGWHLVSVGPDGYLGQLLLIGGWPPLLEEMRGTIFLSYDPTNGTISPGNIYAGEKGGIDQAGERLMQMCF